MNIKARWLAIIAITVLTSLCLYLETNGDVAMIAISGLLGFLAGDGENGEKKEEDA